MLVDISLPVETTDALVGLGCALTIAYNPELQTDCLLIAGAHAINRVLCHVHPTSTRLNMLKDVGHVALCLAGARGCSKINIASDSWLMAIPQTLFWWKTMGYMIETVMIGSVEYITYKVMRFLERNQIQQDGINTIETILNMVNPIRRLGESALETAAPLRCATKPPPKDAVEAINPECAVCAGEFVDTKTLHRVLPCRHAFHASCIDQWLLQRSDKCPMCQVPVKVSHATTRFSVTEGTVIELENEIPVANDID